MCKSYRVAIADDEPVVLAYLRECLERSGHQVGAEAQTGEDLVRKCKSSMPDVIVTDVKMADEMDGLTAVDELIQQRPTPVIVLSAYHDETLIDRAGQCRVQAYLVKPIKEQDLLTSIPLAVQRFGELQALREEASTMRQALADRKTIERAKGIIMKKLRLDEASAFRMLQKMARDQRRKLADVAESVLVAEQLFYTTP